MKIRQKGWRQLKFIAILLILFLPLYFWFLVNLYQTAIQIPREWKQFRTQETSILNALDKFSSENQHYPETLAQLLEPSVWQSENWSFRYGTDDKGGYILQADLPKLWFSWPTRRVCHSQQDDSVACNFYYICYSRQGAQWLSDPIQENEPGRPLLGTSGASPCVSSS